MTKSKKIRGFSIINSMEAENIFKFQLLVVEIGRHLEKKHKKVAKSMKFWCFLAKNSMLKGRMTKLIF